MRLTAAFMLSLISVVAGCAAAPAAEPLPDWKSYWDFENPAASEARFREVLPRAEAAGDALYALTVRTQIARALGLQNKFAEATALLDEVDRAAAPEMADLRVRIQLERGRVLNASGKPLEAVPVFIAAHESALAAGLDGLAVDAAHMVAISAPPADGLPWAERAIATAEKSGDAKVRNWLGPLYNNTAWTCDDLGQRDRALDLFRKGYEFRLLSGWTTETVIALWAVGQQQRKVGQLTESLSTLETVMVKWREIGKEPDGHSYEELAETLLALGREDDAVPHCRKAWELLSSDPWHIEHEAENIARMKKYGRVPDDAVAPASSPSPAH